MWLISVTSKYSENEDENYIIWILEIYNSVCNTKKLAHMR